MSTLQPSSVAFPALGTTAELMVTQPEVLPRAHELLRAELDAFDRACSRFREDSELMLLAAAAGHWAPVSPLLAEALGQALRVAWATGGLVDPTVGDAVARLGYDRDFTELPDDRPAPSRPARPAPGWWRVQLDTANRRVRVPAGVALDLGATAKALAADRAADLIARRCGCGVLVSLGGDLAVADPAHDDRAAASDRAATAGTGTADGGWLVGVGDDHRRHDRTNDQVVTVISGGLATSSTTQRTWRMAGRAVHHIVDPRTGDAPVAAWRTVSVAAASCIDANAASTSAIVLGPQAPSWLERRGLPARLVDEAGRVTVVAGWPQPPQLPPTGAARPSRGAGVARPAGGADAGDGGAAGDRQ